MPRIEVLLMLWLAAGLAGRCFQAGATGEGAWAAVASGFAA